ncbi:nicotinate-nucleotide pyrophosphorylase [Thermococcus sp. Bubb.Bath]|uniref:nicotinate-nucleotide pyrophosphorylase n=1 Tax=Thermococcus sp. Bubb.Bath TaxID=1638242 RepID=UPI00143C96F1|nr:nicotinate-nucleotide pyrophosphorylase [Thermococcus sp. Bubb.Bath]NJF24620.1 nicotinate-nucleotide pyrophosphorylase [Thermococcus sp. Bubb.Bath]
MNPARLFELYLDEDCPYFDETCELLGIEGKGTMEVISREKGIATCTEELSSFLSSLGLNVRFLPSGSEFDTGSTLLQAEGDLKTLFKVWRVSQTFLSITCAIATETRKLVEKARKVNPDVIIATTRKAHPGMRYFEIKAVRIGGGEVHRNSLSDSVLITQNHLQVVSPLGKLKSMKKIEIEPRTAEEAVKYSAVADLLLLDHFTLDELEALVPRLRKLNPKLEIAVAGDINEENVAEYARLADVIITSAPYYSRPLDLTTRIEKADSVCSSFNSDP